MDRKILEPCGARKEGSVQSEKIKKTQSFARSMTVLQLIAEQDEAPGVSELLSFSGLTRPPLYRILSSL